MQTYDLPVSENLTPEEARAALETIHAAAAGDLMHPYSNPHDPRHRRFVEGVQALHVVANPPAVLGLPLSAEDEADLAAEIKRLEATSGYFSGKLRQESLVAHTRLVAKIHELYQCLAEGRAAAEQAAAEAEAVDPAEARERAEQKELDRAVQAVQRAEHDAAEAAAGEQDTEADDDDELA